MSHLRLRSAAVLAAAVLVIAATTACEPGAAFDGHSTSPTIDRGGPGECEEGWVCGTCPDGRTWGYLNDPKYTNDPTISTLGFDNKRPCG